MLAMLLLLRCWTDPHGMHRHMDSAIPLKYHSCLITASLFLVSNFRTWLQALLQASPSRAQLLATTHYSAFFRTALRPDLARSLCNINLYLARL